MAGSHPLPARSTSLADSRNTPIGPPALSLPERIVPAPAPGLVRTGPPPPLERTVGGTPGGGRQPPFLSRRIPAGRCLPPTDLLPHLGGGVPPRLAATLPARPRLHKVEALYPGRGRDQGDDENSPRRRGGRHLPRGRAFVGRRTLAHPAGGVKNAGPGRGARHGSQPRWLVPVVASMGTRPEAGGSNRQVERSRPARSGPGDRTAPGG